MRGRSRPGRRPIPDGPEGWDQRLRDGDLRDELRVDLRAVVFLPVLFVDRPLEPLRAVLRCEREVDVREEALRERDVPRDLEALRDFDVLRDVLRCEALPRDELLFFALRLVLEEDFLRGAEGTFAPSRRASERPMAMACFVFRTPCSPLRTLSISARTNSPAWVLADFPARASLRARSMVRLSGIIIFSQKPAKRNSCLPPNGHWKALLVALRAWAWVLYWTSRCRWTWRSTGSRFCPGRRRAIVFQPRANAPGRVLRAGRVQ